MKRNIFKKVIGLGLVAVLGFSLAACSSESGSSATSTNEENEGTDNNISDEQDTGTKNTSSKNEIFNEAFRTSATIDETVLWDEDDFKITATSLTYSDSYVFLNLTFENYSDKTLTFFSGSSYSNWCAVNGYMVYEDGTSYPVDPGESVDGNFYVYMSSINLLGIKEIADIQLVLAIADEDGNLSELSPVQIKTSAYDSYDYNADTFADLVNKGQFERATDFNATYTAFDTLYSKNDISMVAEILAEPEDDDTNDGYPAFYFEMVNQSGYNILVQPTNISINGVMLEEYFWDSYAMFSDTKAVPCLNFYELLWIQDDEVLDAINLEAGINNITFDLVINNESGEEALAPETISIDF